MSDAHSDRVAFARDVLGLEVFDHQAPALRSAAPVVVVAGGRRSGKTAASQIAALHTCFTRRNVEWLAISTNEEKVRDYLRELVDLTAGRPCARDAVLDDDAMRINFASGSSVVGLRPTEGQIRGHGRRTFGATLDEAGFHRPGVWRALRYVLLDHVEEGAQAWMIGSPWQPTPDHFFRESWDFGMTGDPDFDAFQWRTDMNPGLPAAWIERERGRLNAAEAAAELDGEWTDSAGRLFGQQLLSRCTADVELVSLARLHGPARLMLGCDWGVSYDRSAAIALARFPVAALNPDRERLSVFGVAAMRIWPAGALLSTVVDDVVAAPARWWSASTEVNGVGSGPSQELLRRLGGRGKRAVHLWNLAATTAARKTDSYARLLWLMEQGRLVLPREPDLLRQLAGLKFTQQQAGTMRIEASDEATHDDVADALAMATGPHTVHGHVKNELVRCASLPIPDADVPGGLEAVETSTGLRLPRHPWLQSVQGTELTSPAAAPLELRLRAAAAAAQPQPEPVWLSRPGEDRLWEVERGSHEERALRARGAIEITPPGGGRTMEVV